MTSPSVEHPRPTARDRRRWRRHLADERDEARVYRTLAEGREGDERDVLLGIAEAEDRHAAHWIDLLGGDPGPQRPGLEARVLHVLARRFGSVFVLALLQRAESRSPYENDADATAQMAADERIHGEVVRALAARGRARMAGTFRAAVFGANDGLVSNLALVMGIGAAGASPHLVLLSGIAGLLAGALSMGAGEFVSVRSQRELLGASRPSAGAHGALGALQTDANELALVYRARGMDAHEAERQAEAVLLAHRSATRHEPCPHGDCLLHGSPDAGDDHEEIGSAVGAAVSSFCFFASGAIVPILPWLVGLSGAVAVVVALVLVGVALMITGGVVGLLSGASPLLRGLRQLAIGYGAAAVTFALGKLFGATLG